MFFDQIRKKKREIHSFRLDQSRVRIMMMMMMIIMIIIIINRSTVHVNFVTT